MRELRPVGRWGRRWSSGLSECQHLDGDLDDVMLIVMMMEDCDYENTRRCE